MKLNLIFVILFGLTAAAEVPSQPLTGKGGLIFADDFSGNEVGKQWRVLWPALSVADGKLKIAQIKPEHSAVGMIPVGAKDVVVEFKFLLGTATSINAVFNDKNYQEGHGGHLVRVSLSPRQIFLADDKERLRHEIEEIRKDPARREEVRKLTAGREAAVSIEIDPATWHACVIEVVNDEMRVSLDGPPVGFLKSSGLAHPVKSDFYFAVAGESQFGEVRIWEATAQDRAIKGQLAVRRISG